MSEAQLAAIAIPGPIDAWVALGFAPEGSRVPLLNGAIECGAADPHLVVVGAAAASIEGVPLVQGEPTDPVDHPNSAFEIDHVVLMTDSIERTSAAIDASLGLAQRRIRETATVRQGFHRFPDRNGARGCIIELVERPDATAVTLWGLVVNVGDLDAFCELAGPLIGDPKQAVQPGRRIATVRREAGLGAAIAVMSGS